MDEIFDRIYRSNPKRDLKKLVRRLGKVGEEYGEAWEAFLGSTSESNFKEKTWIDFREEMIDVLIIAIDILYTDLGDGSSSKEEIEEEIIRLFHKKMDKWDKQLASGNDATMS